MPIKKKTVLFLTPSASSVGGNIFLLNFLRWLKANTRIPFVTLYEFGGDLASEFAKLGPAYCFDYSWDGLSPYRKNLQRIDKMFGVRQKKIIREIGGHQVGLIYSNAVINHRTFSAVSHIPAPVVAHCHELETLIQKHGIENFDTLRSRCSHFVAAAEAVQKNLVERHSIPAEAIDVIHEFIPVVERGDAEINSMRSAIRSELNIPADAFVVGASGTMYWRKGPDLFIQIASRFKQKFPRRPFKFIWIGGARAGDASLIEARYDAEKLGLADDVLFIEHLSDPVPYYSAIDAFALTSREDPFPLVCLEAASLGKPMVCFADAGGMPEFVRDDAGYAVPYLDLDAFAARLIELEQDPEMSVRLGTTARCRVSADHDVTVLAPKMLAIIEEYLAA
jgi:glycosyltransferase involved in cell wall biosynthesis